MYPLSWWPLLITIRFWISLQLNSVYISVKRWGFPFLWKLFLPLKTHHFEFRLFPPLNWITCFMQYPSLHLPNSLLKEINSYCLFIFWGENAPAIFLNHWRFSNSSVTHYHHLGTAKLLRISTLFYFKHKKIHLQCNFKVILLNVLKIHFHFLSCFHHPLNTIKLDEISVSLPLTYINCDCLFLWAHVVPCAPQSACLVSQPVHTRLKMCL